MIRVLFIGDIYGKPGRRVLLDHLPRIRSQFDVVVANGENAAGGFGINKDSVNSFLKAGVDVITLGNHTWDNKEIFDILQHYPQVIRPINYPLGTLGQGYHTLNTPKGKITVVNAMGRIFLDPIDCPFQALNEFLQKPELGEIFIDFHAEATSEKNAFAHFLDGRVGAVVGTHTHIPTADTRVLPKGTGYQTDAGMTGVVESVIGADLAAPIARFVERFPHRWTVAEGVAQLNGVIFELDNGCCTHIERYQYTEGA